MTRPALRVVRPPTQDAVRDSVMYARANLAPRYHRARLRGDRRMALKFLAPLVGAYRGEVVYLVRVRRTELEEAVCDQVMAAMPELVRRFDEHQHCGWPDVALGALTEVMTP